MSIKCRICGSDLKNSTDRLVLLDCPLTDEFNPVDMDNSNTNGYISTINIIRCSNCDTVQNPCNFNYSDYYSEYAYTSALSAFTKSFMTRYADICMEYFIKNNKKSPLSVIEPGSGDGQQLKIFKQYGLKVKGVEPSQVLAKTAQQNNIETDICLFDENYIQKGQDKYDICISSYTLDHCPDPISYIISSNKIQRNGGIIAFEIHNFTKIANRAEYCLFEHEHTIYLTETNVKSMVEACGYKVLSINPIDENLCRANSLIVIGQKSSDEDYINIEAYITNNLKSKNCQLELIDLEIKIKKLISQVDNWIKSIDGEIVGYGAGGRGIMTLAQLKYSYKFRALLDIAYSNKNVSTPKTAIPVIGPEKFKNYKNSYVLVFSFGYFSEIKTSLIKEGYKSSKIKSLKDFMI